jgi:hypothetical protein
MAKGTMIAMMIEVIIIRSAKMEKVMFYFQLINIASLHHYYHHCYYYYYCS